MLRHKPCPRSKSPIVFFFPKHSFESWKYRERERINRNCSYSNVKTYTYILTVDLTVSITVLISSTLKDISFQWSPAVSMEEAILQPFPSGLWCIFCNVTSQGETIYFFPNFLRFNYYSKSSWSLLWFLNISGVKRVLVVTPG